MLSKEQSELLALLSEQQADCDVKLYIVGGFIRDILLGYELTDRDIDLCVEGNSRRFTEHLVAIIGGEPSFFPKFQTAKIRGITKFPGIHELDFATARSEVYPEPGQLPVVTPASIEADLKRRDFTLNALAVSLPQFLEWAQGEDSSGEDLKCSLLDTESGLVDLEQRVLRVIHEKSFIDDPTRVLRGARYSVKIDGDFEPGTRTLLGECVSGGGLKTVSTFRLFTELKKTLVQARSAEMITRFNELGVFSEFQALDPHQLEPVTKMLSKLDALGAATDQEMKLQVGLRVCLGTLSSEARGKLLRQVQVGKKKIALFEQDLSFDFSSKVGDLTDIGLLYQCVRTVGTEQNEELLAEVHARKQQDGGK